MHNTILQIRQLLVDASASMEFHRTEILDAIADHLGDYQRFVARHPDKTHKAGLSYFNTRLTSPFFMVDAGHIPELVEAGYQPEGDTALFDAISTQIDQIEQSLQASGDADRAIVDFHLLTDGVDTGSENIRFADLRVRMDKLKATGRWYFQFSLADLDMIELNALLGLRRRLVEKTSADELRRALVDFLTPHPDAASSDNDPHSPNSLPPKNH